MDADKGDGRPRRSTRPEPGGELTERVIAAYFAVYRELGAGFLESVYVAALRIELRDMGLAALPEATLPVCYRGRTIGEFRADLLIEGKLVVEVKACAALSPVHQAQLINYLRASGLPLGLLLNFGPKPAIKRVIWSGSHLEASGMERAAPRSAKVRLEESRILAFSAFSASSAANESNVRQDPDRQPR